MLGIWLLPLKSNLENTETWIQISIFKQGWGIGEWFKYGYSCYQKRQIQSHWLAVIHIGFFLQVVGWASMPDVKRVYKKCSIQLIRDVSGNNPFISPKWHTCRGKILLLCSRGKNGNRTACKWKVAFSLLFFHYDFHVTNIPVHTLRYFLSVAAAYRRTQKIQKQMKTNTSSYAMKAERNDLALPVFIFGFHVLIFWSPYAADAVQSISGWRN